MGICGVCANMCAGIYICVCVAHMSMWCVCVHRCIYGHVCCVCTYVCAGVYMCMCVHIDIVCAYESVCVCVGVFVLETGCLGHELTMEGET